MKCQQESAEKPLATRQDASQGCTEKKSDGAFAEMPERAPLRTYNVHSWIILLFGIFFEGKKKANKEKMLVGKRSFFCQLIANRKIWLFLAFFF